MRSSRSFCEDSLAEDENPVKGFEFRFWSTRVLAAPAAASPLALTPTAPSNSETKPVGVPRLAPEPKLFALGIAEKKMAPINRSRHYFFRPKPIFGCLLFRNESRILGRVRVAIYPGPVLPCSRVFHAL